MRADTCFVVPMRLWRKAARVARTLVRLTLYPAGMSKLLLTCRFRRILERPAGWLPGDRPPTITGPWLGVPRTSCTKNAERLLQPREGHPMPAVATCASATTRTVSRRRRR